MSKSRVLVTGAAGTVGQAVSRRLIEEGDWEVRVSDQHPVPSWLEKRAEVHTGDLRERGEALEAALGCDHVIHLAAIVGGIANFHQLPYTLTDVNSSLYSSVIGAAIEAGIERFVYVSSSMVFENAELFPTPESYLPNCPVPTSAYGFSKLAGEHWVRAANDEHGLPFTICRPFNAYGPGELPRDEPGVAHAVPDLIRKCLALTSDNDPLPIFGDGTHTRTLTHVDDIADGIVTAMASPAGLNEDFNISADRELTIAQIAEIIWESCGRDPEAFSLKTGPSFDVDVVRRWPDTSKARESLGWAAARSFEDGVAETVAYIRDLT